LTLEKSETAHSESRQNKADTAIIMGEPKCSPANNDVYRQKQASGINSGVLTGVIHVFIEENPFEKGLFLKLLS